LRRTPAIMDRLLRIPDCASLLLWGPAAFAPVVLDFTMPFVPVTDRAEGQR